LKAKSLTEKWQHMILKPIRDSAGVCAGINFKAVRDSVLIKDFMQLAGINA
jgi:hypothetical protein